MLVYCKWQVWIGELLLICMPLHYDVTLSILAKKQSMKLRIMEMLSPWHTCLSSFYVSWSVYLHTIKPCSMEQATHFSSSFILSIETFSTSAASSPSPLNADLLYEFLDFCSIWMLLLSSIYVNLDCSCRDTDLEMVPVIGRSFYWSKRDSSCYPESTDIFFMPVSWSSSIAIILLLAESFKAFSLYS